MFTTLQQPVPTSSWRASSRLIVPLEMLMASDSMSCLLSPHMSFAASMGTPWPREDAMQAFSSILTVQGSAFF